ncbi:MAG: hypothetical protein PUF69_04940 [Eubacteriales bacterium]|nr:hypothetical protein [Eubacteriales bacterium]
MADTYIKLFRKATENDLFNEKPFDRWHAFEWLLLKACRFEKTEVIKGQVVKLETGQLIVSLRKLAETFGWSRGKLERFCTMLESMQMASFDRATYGASVGTIVTIENYSRYQDGRATSEATYDTTDSTSDSTTNRATDSTSIKKEKKDKKDKNNIYNSARTRVSHGDGVSKFTKPTLQEVKAYCIERKNDVDPERFIDFYESNGWMVGKNRMKDWRAAVRNWERNKASKSAEQVQQEGRLDWIDEL